MKRTTEQKIQDELTYVTKVMQLDPFQQKHWYYRLKREYEAQEKLEKRLEQKLARKAYRKMLKKTDIKKTLEQIEDYDSFYDRDDDNVEQNAIDKEEEEKLNHIFLNENDKIFYEYGKDMDFVKFHKRTTRNFKTTLASLINSPKMTMTRGVAKDYQISLGLVKLNKACSLVHVFW